MIEDFLSRQRSAFSAEEEMIRMAEELPPLSSDLRSRVLRSAFQAHLQGRRRFRMQAFAAAILFLTSGVLLTSFYFSLWQSQFAPAKLVIEDHGQPSGTVPFHPPEWDGHRTVAMDEWHKAMRKGYTDDWRLVEICVAVRSENLANLRYAFWD